MCSFNKSAALVPFGCLGCIYFRLIKEEICPNQVLAAPLTLSQPGGGQIMPTLYWCPNQVLKATGAPALIKIAQRMTYIKLVCQDHLTLSEALLDAI